MAIKTERTVIRLIEEDDWRQIQRIWNDFARLEYARYDRPSDTDDSSVQPRIAEWAAANRAGTEHMFFAVCVNDTIIGYCAFNKRENGYEIGCCFDSAYHGRGYAKESLSALLRKMGINRYTAGTGMENKPSAVLLKALVPPMRHGKATVEIHWYRNKDIGNVDYKIKWGEEN